MSGFDPVAHAVASTASRLWMSGVHRRISTGPYAKEILDRINRQYCGCHTGIYPEISDEQPHIKVLILGHSPTSSEVSAAIESTDYHGVLIITAPYLTSPGGVMPLNLQGVVALLPEGMVPDHLQLCLDKGRSRTLVLGVRDWLRRYNPTPVVLNE